MQKDGRTKGQNQYLITIPKDEGLLIVNDDSRTVKPKSLIHAISEIEQFSVAEMHSEPP